MLDYILSRMKEIASFPSWMFIELSAAAFVFYEYFNNGDTDSILAILVYVGMFVGSFVVFYLIYMGIWIIILAITALFKVHQKGEVTINEFQFCIIPVITIFILLLFEILKRTL